MEGSAAHGQAKTSGRAGGPDRSCSGAQLRGHDGRGRDGVAARLRLRGGRQLRGRPAPAHRRVLHPGPAEGLALRAHHPLPDPSVPAARALRRHHRPRLVRHPDDGGGPAAALHPSARLRRDDQAGQVRACGAALHHPRAGPRSPGHPPPAASVPHEQARPQDAAPGRPAGGRRDRHRRHGRLEVRDLRRNRHGLARLPGRARPAARRPERADPAHPDQAWTS